MNLFESFSCLYLMPLILSVWTRGTKRTDEPSKCQAPRQSLVARTPRRFPRRLAHPRSACLLRRPFVPLGSHRLTRRHSCLAPCLLAPDSLSLTGLEIGSTVIDAAQKRPTRASTTPRRTGVASACSSKRLGHICGNADQRLTSSTISFT
jgi:hypothetical protein